MVVTFPFSFGGKETKDHIEIGELFVRVLRKQPNVEIVQMTDDTTRAIKGVDSCFRVPLRESRGNPSNHKAAPGTAFGEWYFDAMSTFPARQFLRLDYDVCVKTDVSDVFAYDFDIAIAKEKDGRMNNGVVFVKEKAFFIEAKTEYLKTEMDNWQDIQTATQRTIDSGMFRVKKLDPSYNQIFKHERLEEMEGAKLLHFKGHRKGFVLDYFK